MNKRYRATRKGAAARELHRDTSQRFVTCGHTVVSRRQWENNFRCAKLLKGAHFWYKQPGDGLWWLGKIHASDPTVTASSYVRFLDDSGPLRIQLSNSYYTVDPNARYCLCCLQAYKTGSVRSGVQRIVDTSRRTFLQAKMIKMLRYSQGLSYVARNERIILFQESSLFQNTRDRQHLLIYLGKKTGRGWRSINICHGQDVLFVCA